MGEPQMTMEPLSYHTELRDYLKSEERELWNWFASAKAKADYTENLRLELLKSTYRLDLEAHPDLHLCLTEVKARLELDIPVTLYQAQNNSQLNASLFFIPGEGHVVFSGPVFNLLGPDELKSVMGHELAHYHLWDREGGEFHIADRLISAVAGDIRSGASHQQTARRYQLYTEIFADRGSFCVTRDMNPVVCSLVKMQTGLSHVSAASYIKQAEEIFAQSNKATEEVTHPEAFIRARALTLWQQQGVGASPRISAMIEGESTFEELDILGQRQLSRTTRTLLEQLLSPKWFQTPATLGHAKLFFDDFKPVAAANAARAAMAGVNLDDRKTREYFSYILLDFAKVDPDLDEMPLAAALDLSRALGFDAEFEKLAAKELKMKVRDIQRVKEHAGEMLAKAEVAGG